MRDHAERSDLGQIRGEFVGHGIGEKLLIWFGGKIFEREDCDRPNGMRAQEVPSSQGRNDKDHGGTSPDEPARRCLLMILLILIRLRIWRRRRRYVLGGIGNGRDRHDEAIPAARQGLNKTRLRGGITENLANFVDGGAQTL